MRVFLSPPVRDKGEERSACERRRENSGERQHWQAHYRPTPAYLLPMERHGEIFRPENPAEIRDGGVDEIEVNNKNQIIWESYLSCCSSASSLPRDASVAEKEIGPPGMGSPIGKKRVMKEGSSSDGRSFIVNFKDLQFHTESFYKERKPLWLAAAVSTWDSPDSPRILLLASLSHDQRGMNFLNHHYYSFSQIPASWFILRIRKEASANVVFCLGGGEFLWILIQDEKVIQDGFRIFGSVILLRYFFDRLR